jgi:polysaccharide export outer membrane protein
MSHVRARASLAIFLALAACASSNPAPPPVADTIAKPLSDSGDYVIGSGDRLSIVVYDNPQISGDVPVRPDGYISIPLLQDVAAAGKTPTQLAQEIQGKLKSYVRDPNVTVVVRDFVGPYDRQVRVIGEAVDPQAIPFRDGMTLLDVMVATKGLTKFAAGNRATLVRRTGTRTESFNVRLNDLVKDGDISQNVKMQPGDTLIIPQSWF